MVGLGELAARTVTVWLSVALPWYREHGASACTVMVNCPPCAQVCANVRMSSRGLGEGVPEGAAQPTSTPDIAPSPKSIRRTSTEPALPCARTVIVAVWPTAG